MNIIFSSCGNDSAALVQHSIELGLDDIHVAYSETHWGAEWWPERVAIFKDYVEANGGEFHVIESVGFRNICKEKQSFPMPRQAFCSYELKIKPAARWLDEIDPGKEAVCLTGVRRCESNRRSDWPEHIDSSENHGGRELWSPLVRHDDLMRDELIGRSGLPILAHKSYECFPCIYAGKNTLREMGQVEVEKVLLLEKELGVGKRSGKPKYMFREASHGGAKGIVEVVKWASHTRYIEGQEDMFSGGCDSGFCGES